MTCFRAMQHEILKQKVCVLLVFSAVVVIFYICPQRRQHTSCHSHSSSSILQSRETMFSNNSMIRHCIKGEIIGLRRSVSLISFDTLSYTKEQENDSQRKAAFKHIFDNRIWGSNKQQKFSASGKLLGVFCN